MTTLRRRRVPNHERFKSHAEFAAGVHLYHCEPARLPTDDDASLLGRILSDALLRKSVERATAGTCYEQHA